MANRILTWSFNRFPEGGVLSPAHYIETDYAPVAVRIHADSMPKVTDAKFNIFNDGVSIFRDTTEVVNSHDINYQMRHVPTTDIELVAGDASDLMAEDFRDGLVFEAGSWVTCKVTSDGGARNVSINLELQPVSDSEEEDE